MPPRIWEENSYVMFSEDVYTYHQRVLVLSIKAFQKCKVISCSNSHIKVTTTLRGTPSIDDQFTLRNDETKRVILPYSKKTKLAKVLFKT